MPYILDRQPQHDNPLSDSEREQRLKDMQTEQARTLREGLGAELYDWCEAFDPDMDILPDDSMET